MYSGTMIHWLNHFCGAPFAIVGVALASPASAAPRDPEADWPVHFDPPRSAAAPTPARARVHIRGTHASFLLRRAAGTTDFETACETPCDTELPIGDTYRIYGSGFRTTADFRLDAPPGGSVDLTVHGPSWVGIGGGALLVLGGTGAASLGALVALADASCGGGGGGTSDSYCGGGGGSAAVLVGMGVLAVGAGAVALGAVIVSVSSKTDVSQRKSEPSNESLAGRPMWRSASSGETGPWAWSPLSYEVRF